MSIFKSTLEEKEIEALDRMIVNEALEMGLIDNKGTELLLENSKPKSIQILKEERQSRVDNLTERACLIQSRLKEDPLFEEWQKAINIAEEVKEKVYKKYSPSVRNRVKESLRAAKQIIKNSK